jgi:hypothetical protein
VTDKQIVIFAEVFGVPVGDFFPPKRKITDVSSDWMLKQKGSIKNLMLPCVAVFLFGSV